MSPLQERTEYENAAGFVIGIVRINTKGEPHGYALEPGDRVWLSEDERRETARAPRDPGDNPFANGHLRKVSDPRIIDNVDRPIDAAEAVAEEPAPAEMPVAEERPPEAPAPPAQEGALPPPPPAREAPRTEPGKPVAVAAGIEERAVATPPEHVETGTAVEPTGAPVEGEYAQHEEVGTPDAQAQAEGASRVSGAPPRPPAVPTSSGGFRPRGESEGAE